MTARFAVVDAFAFIRSTPWWLAQVGKYGEPEALRRLEQQRQEVQWEELAQRARDDVNVFMELCFKDDQAPVGTPAFAQQWFHREWQDIWQTRRISVIHGATGFGKTDQVVGHILWRIGRNPSLRVMLVGKKAGNAQKLLLKIKRQIESNKVLRAIFPDLRPGEPWNTEVLRVAGAGLDTTTSTVEIYGLDGSPQGVRGDIILLDDVIDLENTRTEEQREKVVEFVDTVVQSRLTTGGQLHILANAWHKDDLAFTYSRRPGIHYGVYPAEDPKTGALLWPAFRSREWLARAKAGSTPSRYGRMYLCQPTSDETRIFVKDWFDAARAAGAGSKPMRVIEHATPARGGRIDPALMHLVYIAQQDEVRVVVGVDLATGRKEKRRKSDFTALVVVALHMRTGLRHILWAESGRWPAPTTLRKLIEYQARYKPNRFVVESNAAQIFLAQFAQEHPDFTARIDNFGTSDLKWDEDLGIEEIGVEMQAGKWVLPGPSAGETDDRFLLRLTPEERDAYAAINQAADHLLEFTRVGHTPDDVMALYFAKEGIKRMLTGTFSRRGDLASTEAEQQRAQASAAGTAKALFSPELAPAVPSPALVPPSPPAPLPPPKPPVTPAQKVSAHVRALLGAA